MNAALQARLNGQLPEIDIAGDVYVIDLAHQRLYAKDDPQRMLWLERMELDGTFDNNYYCYYNTRTRTMQHIDTDRIRGLPSDVIKVILPHDGILDPVYVAKEWIDYTDELIRRDQFIDLHLKATLVPLRQTNLQQFAIRNLLRERDQPRKWRRKL